MPPKFDLHPALEATSIYVTDSTVCQVRLQRDARFPWLVLIPRVDGAIELDDLSRDQRLALMDEITAASGAVRALGDAWGRPVEKLNVAALGNVTPQLHVHVLGRRRDDGLWPDPVWGRGAALPYADEALEAALTAARTRLARAP